MRRAPTQSRTGLRRFRTGFGNDRVVAATTTAAPRQKSTPKPERLWCGCAQHAKSTASPPAFEFDVRCARWESLRELYESFQKFRAARFVVRFPAMNAARF